MTLVLLGDVRCSKHNTCSRKISTRIFGAWGTPFCECNPSQILQPFLVENVNSVAVWPTAWYHTPTKMDSSAVLRDAADVLKDALALVLEHRPKDPVAFITNHLHRADEGASHREHAFRILELGARSATRTSSSVVGARELPLAAESLDESPLKEDTIVAAYHSLRRRGQGHSASAASAKLLTRSGKTGTQFRFGESGGGIFAKDVHALARRVLTTDYAWDAFPSADGHRLFVPHLASRVLDMLPVDESLSIIDYSRFALCFRTLYRLRSLLADAHSALVAFVQSACLPVPNTAHAVRADRPAPRRSNTASRMEAFADNHAFYYAVASKQRFQHFSQGVQFLASLLSLDAGKLTL